MVAGVGGTGGVGGAAVSGSAVAGGRPRLMRQPAVVADEPPTSPGALPPPRLLHTIPSAAETEAPAEEGDPR